MSAQLHRKTPTLRVIDSRGLTVRQVAYWRSDAAKTAQARITRQEHDVAGQPIAHWDPRLFGQTTKANLTNIHSLSGKLLMTDSVDAGWRVNLPGDAGQVLRRWDQRGSYQQSTYDDQLRPVCIEEQAAGQVLRVVERFNYGDSSQASAASNSCGALTRHDDNAGTLLITGYALCAKPRAQKRRFLLDPQRPDWPTNTKDRDDLLEAKDGHETTWQYNALGEPIQQVDAGKHQQDFSFDVAGQLKTISLLIKDTKVAKTVIKDLVYNAAGQIESQTAGNGVTSRAVFDPASGRMTSLSASVSTSTLQDFRYTYDAVGNVLRIEDKAQPVHFGSNQKVEAISAFTYDSLYQLTSATGRESAVQTPQLPLAANSRSPLDAQQMFNYSEHYQYDVGGNLTELRHARDNNNYTRTFKVATANNRLQSWNKGDATPEITSGFDAGGNQQQLNPGQVMEWNARNQLSSVMLIARAEGRDDIERYYYDSSGQRVRKLQTTHAASIVHDREVRYLPGLEIRTRNNERLEVITLQAGRCSVRYLHWTNGRPAGIAENQLRYSLDDHLGSSSLELDDRAWLISQESYLPYGGTAWAASRSAVEADYRTIRYSGKERDASGLYYYGARYYAPWLQRWVSPDPAGAIDGLNLYCMVGNNPVRFVDHQGLMRDEDIQEFARWGRSRSQEIMNSSVGNFENPSMPDNYDKSSDQHLNPDLLRREFLAHSYGYVASEGVGMSDFFNLPKPRGSMRGYRGVDHDHDGSATHPEQYLRFGTFKISNTAEYLTDLTQRYAIAANTLFHGVTIEESVLRDVPTLSRTVDNVHVLQQPVRDMIAAHIDKVHGVMPQLAGGPGSHAEVRLTNTVVALYPDRAERILSDTTLYTDTLSRGDTAQPFPGCFNCSGIIPAEVNIPTGRNNPDYDAYNNIVAQWDAPRFQRSGAIRRPHR